MEKQIFSLSQISKCTTHFFKNKATNNSLDQDQSILNTLQTIAEKYIAQQRNVKNSTSNSSKDLQKHNPPFKVTFIFDVFLQLYLCNFFRTCKMLLMEYLLKAQKNLQSSTIVNQVSHIAPLNCILFAQNFFNEMAKIICMENFHEWLTSKLGKNTIFCLYQQKKMKISYAFFNSIYD